MNDKNLDVRWKQRFAHYTKAFILLEQTMTIEAPSDAERAGLIQFFEICFELAWKVLQDYLEEGGFRVTSPREAVKVASLAGLIRSGHIWMEALKNRNLTVRTYEETTAIAVEKKIRDSYFPEMAELFRDFREKVNS